MVHLNYRSVSIHTTETQTFTFPFCLFCRRRMIMKQSGCQAMWYRLARHKYQLGIIHKQWVHTWARTWIQLQVAAWSDRSENLIKHSLESHVIFFFMTPFSTDDIFIHKRLFFFFCSFLLFSLHRPAIGIMTTVQHLAQMWHQRETIVMEIH